MSSGFIAASFPEISEVLVYRTNFIFVKKDAHFIKERLKTAGCEPPRNQNAG
jgi:hypothetical protein